MPSPRSRPPVVRAVRTPEALDALHVRMTMFGSAERQRGRDIQVAGGVRKTWSEADHHFKAEVADEACHALTFFFTRGEWSSRCSCGAPRDCAHAYAAALAWIAAVESGARDGRDPAELSAFASAMPPGRLPPPLSAPIDDSPASDPVLERELAVWLDALTPHRDAGPAAAPESVSGLAGLRVRLSASGGWFIEIRLALEKAGAHRRKNG